MADHEDQVDDVDAPANEHEDDTHVPGITGDAKFSAVAVATGEEGEDELWKRRCKLFRFDKDEATWKERGTGEVKFLRSRETGKIRILMRNDGTLKIRANHYVLPQYTLKASAGSDRSWVWTAVQDVSDDSASDQVLAIRFQTPEIANEFRDRFEAAKTGAGAVEHVPAAASKTTESAVAPPPAAPAAEAKAEAAEKPAEEPKKEVAQEEPAAAKEDEKAADESAEKPDEAAAAN